MSDSGSRRGPRRNAKKLAVTCVLTLCVGASMASSPPNSPVVAGATEAHQFTLDADRKAQEFTVVVDANAAAVPSDPTHTYFTVELVLTVTGNASGPAEVMIIGDAGTNDPPIRLGLARGEMRIATLTAPEALDSCHSKRRCTRGMTITVKHISGGAISIQPSAEAAIGWQEWDEPRSGAEVALTFLDLEPASED